MLRLVVLLAAAVSAHAGVIKGVVLEQASGRALARTIVRLDPVPDAKGPKGQPLTTRAGRAGQFTFPPIAPGLYILAAIRDGYFTTAYGQRLPTGRGTPIEVTADSQLFAELRLRHKGAITGRVLDENGVATAGITVLAYRAKLPLRLAGGGLSDDRGVYRVHGLEPGRYWIRSAAYTLDDGSGWLPTFGPVAREVRDARIHRVTLDSDASDADVSPEPGALFHLGGIVTCDTAGPIIVTISSETGRRRTQTACPLPGIYRMEGLGPGVYEVFAATQDGGATGFTDLFVDRDTDSAGVHVMQLPTVDIEVRRAGSNAPVTIPMTLMGRRQDLADSEAVREITGARTTLAPGHWEFRARVPPGQYVESIVATRGSNRRPWQAERLSDWFDVFVEPRFPSRIRVTVSDQAGQIGGKVVAEGKSLPGVPVFLWPVQESARRSLSGPLQVLSDTEGRFHFDGLPPGDYRLLASFDVNEVDEEVLELARAVIVRADASQTATVDLTVWIATF